MSTCLLGGARGVPGCLALALRAPPTLSLCLYFVSLTFLAIMWKSTFSSLCYFLNVLSQVLGPIFNWQTEHTDVQADTSGEGPEGSPGCWGLCLASGGGVGAP